MDKTSPSASSASKSRESPSPPLFDSDYFFFNSSALRGGDLTPFAGGFHTVMGMTASGCSTAPPKRLFAFKTRARTGLRVQVCKSLKRRRRHLLRLSNIHRRRGRRCPQFQNLGRNRQIFLSGARGFPFHTSGLPRQRL